MRDRDDLDGLRPATRMVLAGRRPGEQHGFVNTPVYRGSTVLFETAEDLAAHRGRYTYGRRGSPTLDALTGAINELEGGAGSVLVPSGLAAVSTALLSCVGAGDHLLMIDSCYQPTRQFCDTTLRRMGVETEYYAAGSDIEPLFRENTRVVYAESPGSQTFEIQDIPALAAQAHRRGALLLMDNTWATPLLFKAHAYGVDVSVQAGTKYFSGHADVLIGSVSANERAWPRVKETHGNLGLTVGPDDVYLTLRGMRTLAVRLARHQESAMRVAGWLSERPEIARVYYPALPDCPGHDIWRRDFSGASGLFSVALRPIDQGRLHAFLNALTLFGMGYSWGGYESLVVPFHPSSRRNNPQIGWEGPGLRFHIGLEDPEDLIADLEQAFGELGRAP